MTGMGIFDRIGWEFSQAIKLIEPKFSSPEAFVNWMNELGWEVPLPNGASLNSLSSSISELIQTITNIDTSKPAIEQVNQYATLFSSAIDFLVSLRNLTNLFPDEGLPVNFFHEAPRQILHYIIISHLETSHNALYAILRFLGVIMIEHQDADGIRLSYTSKTIIFSRLITLLQNPTEIFTETYGWASDNFDIVSLMAALQLTTHILRIPSHYRLPSYRLTQHLYADIEPTDYIPIRSLQIPLLEISDMALGFAEVGISLLPLFTKNLATGLHIPGGLVLQPYARGTIDLKIPLGELFTLELSGSASGDMFVKIGREGLNIVSFNEQNVLGTFQGAFKIHLVLSREGEDIILIGQPEESRLQINKASIGLGILADKQGSETNFELKVIGGKLVISGGQEDGLLSKIIPEGGIESIFDLTIGWSSMRGVYFEGSATLEITLPVHKSLGPITLDTIFINLSLPSGAEVFPITLAITIGAKIGPIAVLLKKIGIIANLSFPEDGGNLGPLNLDLGFKWPDGASLSIDTAGLKGGGYLEYDCTNKRYVGVLQLTFSEIGLIAITLITTRMPDGSKGFSMLSLINVSFNPAISLPYNFKLHGVGGLLGIQRTMKTDVIRDGLKNGILDSVMFPEGDIIQRAPQIISDLRTIFPPTESRYVIGLMAKLSWSELIYGDVGLFIEIPMPIKIALLGQIYSYLPSEKAPIVELHLDILGVLDLEQKKLYIMASIYNSRILIIELSGDAYIGVSWGNKPYFVLSLGGFHPKDKSIPSDIPSLRRLKMSMGSGNNPRLTFETYFAVTSTSLGFGAKFELYAKAGCFSVEGYLGFDTLFIYSPFSFEVSLGAGIAVKMGAATLLSIALDMLLAGPTPWHAKGTAKFKILFFTIKVGFDVKWGKRDKSTLPSVDPWPDLKEALEHKKSWSGALPEEQHNPVQIRLVENTGTDIVVFPTGFLEIRQNILPLCIKITKYKNTKPPGDDNEFVIERVAIMPRDEDLHVDPTLDYFARPQYQEMSDSEKLSSPAYEKLESGKRCQATQISVETKREYVLVYETEVIDENKCARILDPTPCKWIMSKYLMKGGIAASVPILNSGSARYQVPVIMPDGELVEEAYAIVNSNDMTLVGSDEIPNNGNSTYVQTLQSMEEYLANHPEKVGEIQIVPQNEVNIVNG